MAENGLIRLKEYDNLTDKSTRKELNMSKEEKIKEKMRPWSLDL